MPSFAFDPGGYLCVPGFPGGGVIHQGDGTSVPQGQRQGDLGGIGGFGGDGGEILQVKINHSGGVDSHRLVGGQEQGTPGEGHVALGIRVLHLQVGGP